MITHFLNADSQNGAQERKWEGRASLKKTANGEKFFGGQCYCIAEKFSALNNRTPH